jgi:O-antigen chain-terminating methyltransferase
VDINHEMVETCRARRLDVSEGDALGFLSGLPDASLGGLFAAQVVEHLQAGYLMRLLETAYHKLRPGSKIILETINPACWFAFFESYLRDITHVRPLHPDTLQYLVSASGFQKVDIRYRVPYPDNEKLGHIAVAESSSYAEVQSLQPLAQVASTLNANADKLNRLLFTYLDYAVVAERL